MNTVRSLVAVSALGFVVAACSSSHSTTESKKSDSSTPTGDAAASDAPAMDAVTTDSTTKDAGPLSIGVFCADWFTAKARLAATCVGGPWSAWEAKLAVVDTCTKIEAAVKAGRIKYDDTQGASCIDAYAKFNCTDAASASEPAVCEQAIGGTVSAGDTCYADLDCSDSNFCSGLGGASGSCSGTCKAPLASGAACEDGDKCVAGYTCTGTGSSKTCGHPAATNPAKKGAPCGYDAKTKVTTVCAPGLSCDLVSRQCVTTVLQGATCTPGASECELYTACDPTTTTCKEFPNAGGGCGYSDGQDVIGCLGQNYCRLAAKSLVGTCTTQNGAGARCVSDGECLSGMCGAATTDAGPRECTAPCTQM
jgi:hypothetical protein